MAVETPRISPTEGAILSVLLERETYGLQIVNEIKERGGRLSLGGVYTLLNRLEQKGLVEGRWEASSNERKGARRRYYRVTGLGRRVLSALRDLFMPAGLELSR